MPSSARRISIDCTGQNGGNQVAALSGTWNLVTVSKELQQLQPELQEMAAKPDLTWDCMNIEALDSAGAMLLWRAWGRKLPEVLLLRPEHHKIFEFLAAADKCPPAPPLPVLPFPRIQRLGLFVLLLQQHLVDFTTLLGQFALDVKYLLRYPKETPRREISANLFKSGVRAMPVTALVGFLIGVVLCYLSSLQLRQFGAEVFIINILGLGVIRELGPMLVAILVAGRSGSAMTAQLGVMRVTEEIDALETMGVQRSLRLVFPKVVALAVAMPLLVLWTITAALIGGMILAQAQLDISYAFFFQTLPKVVPVANIVIALCKGVVFGTAIALVACHFGLRVRPNTESLSANTTSSVVSAITIVILLDALFAIATRSVGVP
ncbi:MAG TPA: ABC transporter permease [Rhodocyclaceae bacterium]|nr:ABC transporter permease [Rhodocyclaceae bacterium]